MGAKVKLLLILTSILHTGSHVLLMANVLLAVYICQEQFSQFFFNSNHYYFDKNVFHQYFANSNGFLKYYDFNFL